MPVFVILKQVLYTLNKNRLRSLLAMVGILWGTFAILLLQAIGTGFYQSSQQQIGNIANGIIYAYPGTTSQAYAGWPIGHQIHLKAVDVMQLQQRLKGIALISPIMQDQQHPAFVTYASRTRHINALGVSADYLKAQALAVQAPGRDFSLNDMNGHARVAIIGQKLSEYLFPHQSAVGKQVRLGGLPLRVIGVIGKKTGGFAADMASINLYLPYTTYIDIHGNQNVSYFLLLPQYKTQSQRLIHAIRRDLAAKFHFAATDKSAIALPNLAQATHFFNWFFFAIQIFLFFAGAMTLGVGAVGVANIMFLIVQERTFEIGLKMALGAQGWHIMLQFLLEALMLVFCGGLMGYLAASGVLAILSLLPLPPWIGHPYISNLTVLVTIIVLALVTVLAGWFPAKKAANLDPVVALEG